MSWVRSLCNTHTHTLFILIFFYDVQTQPEQKRLMTGKKNWLVQCWSTRANSGITKASEADFCQLAIVDVVFILRPSSWILPALAGLKNMDVVFNANILNQIWLPTVTTCCCVFSTSHIWAHSKCKPGWLSELCEHKVRKRGWDRKKKHHTCNLYRNVHLMCTLELRVLSVMLFPVFPKGFLLIIPDFIRFLPHLPKWYENPNIFPSVSPAPVLVKISQYPSGSVWGFKS